MGRLGILGLCISKRYGGSGFDYNCLAIACEELEKVDNSARLTITTHVASYVLPLVQWGNNEQKVKYLIPAVKGQSVGAFALSESQAGSDVSNIKTTARKEGDHYVLNGTKMWVSLIDVADNFLVIAQTDSELGKKSFSCLIVERDFPGVETQSISGKMYIRMANTGQLVLNNVRVPKENLLGLEGEGLRVALSSIDNSRFTVAAGAVGLIQGCLEACVKYARERTAFDQPIGNFQLIQSKIVDIVASEEIAKLLVRKVGWLKNKGQICTREIALAKWYACEQAFEAASHAIQIHGAYAYLNDLPLERYLRNAKGAMIYTGTNEIQEIIIAQYALGFRKDQPIRKHLPRWPFEDDC
jgi:alkylation response protein AidB-like acyl-CoA dehydrogenase